MSLLTSRRLVAAALVSLLWFFQPWLGAGERPGLAGRLGQLLERAWPARPEWGDMAVALLRGEGLDGEKGWWRRAGKRLGWEWLRMRFDADRDGRVERGELPGADWCFARLDRDGDGAIGPEDFHPSRAAGREAQAASVFQRLDSDSNGRVSREELAAFFARADRGGLGYLTREDLALALWDPGPAAGGGRDEMPSPWRMLGMLLSGQLGSLRSGPRAGEPAPDFRLETREGKSYRLSDSRGKRPVVLIFGSFT